MLTLCLCVSEVESAAEAKIASCTVSAEDAGVPLGLSGWSNTTWSPPASPGLAEVLTALSQTARAWVRVCRFVFLLTGATGMVQKKKKMISCHHLSTDVCRPLGWLQVDVLAEGSSKALLRPLCSGSFDKKSRRCLTFTTLPAKLSG